MGTLTEKLRKTLSSKKKIKAAIERHGVMVGNKPFNEYGDKIDQIGSDVVMQPDWINIFDVLTNDLEEYTYKSVYLLTDELNTIGLGGGIAYKTSDSNEVFTLDSERVVDGKYTFTGAGDVPCSEGYKTRYLIVYHNFVNQSYTDKPQGIETVTLGCILDGRGSYTNFLFEKNINLKFAHLMLNISSIGENMFSECTSLVNLSHDNKQITLGGKALNCCFKLKVFEITEDVRIPSYSSNPSQMLNLDSLVLPSGSTSSYAVFDNVYAANFTLYLYGRNGYHHNTNGIRAKKLKLVQVDKVSGSIKFSPSNLFESIEFSAGYNSNVFSYLAYANNIREISIPHGVQFIEVSNFMGCKLLRYVYLPNTITTSMTSTSYYFKNCPNLSTIELEDGYNAPLDISLITSITTVALVNMCSALKDLTGETAKIFKIGATNLAKLTDEEKAIVTNKNWTLS